MENLVKVSQSIDEKENNGSRRTRSSKLTKDEEINSNELTDNSHLVPLSPKFDSILSKKNFGTLRSKGSPKQQQQQASLVDEIDESPVRKTRQQKKNSISANSSYSESDSPGTPNAFRSSRRNKNEKVSPKNLLSTSLSEILNERKKIINKSDIENKVQKVETNASPKEIEFDDKDPPLVGRNMSSAENSDNSSIENKQNKLLQANDENLNEISVYSKESSDIESSQDFPKEEQQRLQRRSLRVNKSLKIDNIMEDQPKLEKNLTNFSQSVDVRPSYSLMENHKETNENDENLQKDLHASEIINGESEDLANNNLKTHRSETKRESASSVEVINISDENMKDTHLTNITPEDLDIASAELDHDLTVGILNGAVVYNILDSEKKLDENDSGHSSADYNDTNLQTQSIFKEERVEEEEDIGITYPDPTSSPSAESLDSAKGSSLSNYNDQIGGLYSTGDVYWGQIFKYSYWPCMICPDPAGNIVQFNTSARSVDHTYYTVHVRFFADNGRRNWVRQENLLPFVSYENFMQLAEEVKLKYGEKSQKYKFFIPSKLKKDLWMDAIREANIIMETKYAERLEKFYSIFERSKNFNKVERKRRESMYQSKAEAENLSESILAVPEKRERSISPTSPAFSPISHKRRKISPTSMKTEEPFGNLLENNPSLNKNSPDIAADIAILFQNPEFKELYGIMREYFLPGCQDPNMEFSLVSGLKNLWALKQINQIRIARELSESRSENDLGSAVVESVGRKGQGMMKRLSNRIRGLAIRKSLTIQTNNLRESVNALSPAISKSSLASPTEKKKKVINRPMDEVIDDIFNLDNKYLFRGLQRDPVCKYCFKPSASLLRCSKKCLTWFHNECRLNPPSNNKKKSKNFRRKRISLPSKTDDAHITADETDLLTKNSTASNENEENKNLVHVEEIPICNECLKNDPPICCICQNSNLDGGKLLQCQMANCQKVFHSQCSTYWPQARTNNGSVRCPSHVCHTCVSDDPKGKFQHISSAKLVKCVKCPASYHMDSTCIPAGSEILTAAHIICPRHHKAKLEAHLNVNWCYICASGGGDVVCCETCPFAVHEKCLNIPLGKDEQYICEECESGRMPLYGEMVWVKFNNYRWWPAIILPPTEVPENIKRKTHNPLEFVVRFFGTHDHGWISRRRVYLYAEGDYSEYPKSKSGLDHNYIKGVDEAKHFFEIIKVRKNDQRTSTENKEKVHPQPYTKIRANRPVPPVKLNVNLENVNKCYCKATDENPCGPDSACLNRALFNECNPKICSAGHLCQNQMFEKRISPRLEVVYMKERGFGLVTREPIESGTFIIEYVGEIINESEFKKRISEKNKDRDENYYFLSIEKDYIIDAGPKGNLARFMNHSCDPNCESQKWSVNSINRVGLFAIKNIPENTELTFNYRWDELLGSEKKTCFCGSEKCAGQIGAKSKQGVFKDNTDSAASKPQVKSKKPLKRLQQPYTPSGKVTPKLSANLLLDAISDSSIISTPKKKESKPPPETTAVEKESLPDLSPNSNLLQSSPKTRRQRRSTSFTKKNQVEDNAAA